MKSRGPSTGPKSSIISIENLGFSYPDGLSALRDVSLRIPRGSKMAILGPNGAGKSTLFLHLNGILKPQHGCVLLEGEPIQYSRKYLKMLRSRVGIVFQDPDNQLFSVNVFQDISFGPMNLKLPPGQVKERVEEAMEITRIADLRYRPTHQLSSGEKKRVAIAGVLAMNPDVIIFDEPTASLDPRLVEEMRILFDTLHQTGKTLLMSTHDMDLAYSWSDYCYVLNKGELLAHGKPDEIFQNSCLVHENDLQIPWVLKVFTELVDKGLINKETRSPRDEQQLISYIRKIDTSASVEKQALKHA